MDFKKHCISRKSEGDIIYPLLIEDFFKHEFEAIMKLIEIYVTFPTANAEISRGFNSTKRIKADFKNKLSGETPRPFDDISDWERNQIVKARWKV